MARIILIDDDEPFREMLCGVLTSEGHEVTLAANGFDGMNLFREKNADLILTDLMMPHGGLPTIRVLREQYPALPIIALSGSRAPLAIAGALGATQLIAKPFALQELISAIAHALKASPRPAAKEQA
jgi:CheY-like chemotaxis protein